MLLKGLHEIPAAIAYAAERCLHNFSCIHTGSYVAQVLPFGKFTMDLVQICDSFKDISAAIVYAPESLDQSPPMRLHVPQDKVASAQAKSDRMAAAVSSWGGSMLRRAFATWKDRHASWQQGHAKAARAAALWHNRALASAWQQWKESAIYQQELRMRLTAAVGRQQCNQCVLAALTASADVVHMHCNPCMRATYLAPGQPWCFAPAFSQAFCMRQHSMLCMLQLQHRSPSAVKATILSDLKQNLPRVCTEAS